MRSNDLKVGEHYAQSNRRGDDGFKHRVKVLEIGVQMVGNTWGSVSNGVRVEFLEEDGSSKGRDPWTVRPRSLRWLWEEEAVKRARYAEIRIEYFAAQEVRGVEVKALVELVNWHLGETAFVVGGNGKTMSWEVFYNTEPEKLAVLIMK